MHISDYSQFSGIHISQGSVATYVRRGGIFQFVADVSLSMLAKEFWKSVNVWRSYGQEISVLFFDSRCSKQQFYINRRRQNKDLTHKAKSPRLYKTAMLGLGRGPEGCGLPWLFYGFTDRRSRHSRIMRISRIGMTMITAASSNCNREGST